MFLNLIDKHVPQDHKFHKIFYKNNMKVSYSCMPNTKSTINSHNRKIIYLTNKLEHVTISKTDCPLQAKYLIENTYAKEILVQKTVNRKFIAVFTKFEARYANHKKYFNYEKHKSDTQLSNELGQYQACHVNAKRSLLCLNEKLQIASYQR